MWRQTSLTDSVIFIVSMVGTALAFAFYGWTWWLLAALAVHLTVTAVFSAVIHRFYCHRAFPADERKMFGLALIPAAYFYTSPAHWLVMHTAHHVHSDTELDTHVKGLRAFFVGGYREPPSEFKRLGLKLFRDKKHLWLHKNFLLVGIAWGLLLLAISWPLFVFAYVVPIFTVHLANRLHRNFSHHNNQACNRWYLEYLVPMGGEWMHDEHHRVATHKRFGDRWYELDLGNLIIKLFGRAA